MRALALAVLLLTAPPLLGQEVAAQDPAARIAELEAEVERLRETVGALRERLAEQPLSESGARTLQNRIRNQILEIETLRQARDACRSDLRDAGRARDRAERRIADADRRAATAEREAASARQAAQRAERDERRAESEVRRLRSQLRRCR